MLRYYLLKTTIGTPPHHKGNATRIIVAHNDDSAREVAFAYVKAMQRKDRNVEFEDVVHYPACT